MTSQHQELAARVVRWQAAHGRNHLPWQNTRDPYRVWLSEIMLQQTQVATVLGYYARFIARFPSVADLAAAPEDEVLALWSGLGYYARARNLHHCAQQVVERHAGIFPANAQQLAQLPGIGRSTAAAIASFCFGERVAILDANVRRVLTRVLGFDADLARAAHERMLWQHAEDLLPREDAGHVMPHYTQGLMDLGAGVCLPVRPDCARCPLASLCVARREGDPERYPVRTRRLQRSAQAWWLLLQEDESGRLRLERRPARGIWAGLYCPPVFGAREELCAALGPGHAELQELPAFTHVLTHRDLHLHPVRVRAAQPEAGQWFEARQWPGLGLPAPVRRLLESLRS